MIVATPPSTGYDAHAVTRHMNTLAPAAATTNLMLNRSSEDELVEDDKVVYSQNVPKGTDLDIYVKKDGKASGSRSATAPQLSSLKDTDNARWVVLTVSSHRNHPYHIRLELLNQYHTIRVF